MALASDLVLDSTAAIAVGTLPAITFSLIGGTQSIRSDAVYSASNPRQLRFAHTTRKLKGFRDAVNNFAAPDVTFDRHLCRLDFNIVQNRYLDPEFLIGSSIQLVVDTPRFGTSSPTTLDIGNRLKAMVSMLTAGSNANLGRWLNNET